MNTFYMVWSPDGVNPTVKHNTKKEAETEAQRLAAKFISRAFFVLEAVSVSQSVAVETTQLLRG